MRLDKKTVVLAIVGAVTLLQLGLAGLAKWSRKATERDLASQQSQLDFVGQMIENARRRAAEPPPKIIAVEQQLLKTPDVAGTLQLIQGIADACKIQLGSVKAAQSATAGKQTFQISGIGNPDEVCKFLAGIEDSARLVIAESGRVSPGTAAEIAFELALATYHEGTGQ